MRAVAQKLDIPYYTLDFSKEDAEKVLSHFVSEYENGRTANTDVLCNSEIKLGPFLNFAKGIGADYIAAGHYAGIERRDGTAYLLRAADENKYQTYFLNQLNQ